MLICLNVLLIFVIGSLSIVSEFFIDEMCVVVLAPATDTMSGATFHPRVMMLLMSGWYLVDFLLRIFVANLSLQYVNSINYMVSFGARASGGGWLYGLLMTHSMSRLSLALQWHFWVPHVHGSSHDGTLFSCGSSCISAFTSV